VSCQPNGQRHQRFEPKLNSKLAESETMILTNSTASHDTAKETLTPHLLARSPTEQAEEPAVLAVLADAGRTRTFPGDR
jgi:hypothetical protein